MSKAEEELSRRWEARVRAWVMVRRCNDPIYMMHLYSSLLRGVC